MRVTSALLVQAGGRMLLYSKLPEGHELTPEQRLLFIGISIGLTVLAGLMSGLTLGLMSLDQVELEVLRRSGSRREQKYAAAIAPVVSNAHFLLVTLLLCNACAMEALPLFLDSLADPVSAIIISVTAVLVFGEVLPQAVCSRYGLAIGYYCSWLVRALMLLTSPISWPIGKLLDVLLGKEHTALYRRGQLKALVDLHGSDEGLGGTLLEEEIKIMCGALDLTHKTARMSLTPLNKVFMLPAEATFDAQTLDSVLDSGHSRIPVYGGGSRHNIIGLILVKDLLRHKPDAGVQVADIRMRSIPRMSADTAMYDMFKLFQTGRSHMIVITDTVQDQTAAAAAATDVPIGIITIEDVIEELMQTEIIDETDLFVDNERSITVSSTNLVQALPAQLRLALAQQQQQQSHHTTATGSRGSSTGGGAGGAEGSSPVTAAAAAAAVQTVRKLIKQTSNRTAVTRGSSASGRQPTAVDAGNATDERHVGVPASGDIILRYAESGQDRNTSSLSEPLLNGDDQA